MSTKVGIYNLELHESTTLPCGTVVMRVPGGWIYGGWDIEKDCDRPGTFVPFNNEFQASNGKS